MLQLHGQLHQHHLQTHQVTMDDLLAMQVAACNSGAMHGSSGMVRLSMCTCVAVSQLADGPPPRNDIEFCTGSTWQCPTDDPSCQTTAYLQPQAALPCWGSWHVHG